MENDSNLLGNPVFWWVVNLFLTIFLGIFANLMTDRVKIFWGKFSSRQRERNAKEIRQIDEWARKCIASQQRFAYVQARLTWNASRQLLLVGAIQYYLILSVAVFIIMGIGLQNQIRTALTIPVVDSAAQLFAGKLLSFHVTSPTIGDVIGVGAVLIQILMLFILYDYFRSLQKSMFWAKVVARFDKLLDEQDTADAAPNLDKKTVTAA